MKKRHEFFDEWESDWDPETKVSVVWGLLTGVAFLVMFFLLLWGLTVLISQ